MVCMSGSAIRTGNISSRRERHAKRVILFVGKLWAAAGETSLEGAVREVREEGGIVVDASRLKLICSLFEPRWNGRTLQEIDDVYLYEMDEEYDAVNAKSDEVAQSKWMTREEIRQLFDQGELVDALAYFFTEIDVEEM